MIRSAVGWIPSFALHLSVWWTGWGDFRPDERRLLRDFNRGRMPAGGFDHRAHAHVAWMYLSVLSPARAIDRFVAALRRFARARGRPELYHETVTWAYLLLIRERMADAPEPESFEAFAARNPDLFARAPSVLERYYESSTLESPLARCVFLLPDRVAGRARRDQMNY
jgi:hypothetical protein